MLHYAATLVLRFFPPLAHPENTAKHPGHRGLQLGGRTLALVSHPAHDAPSRTLVRPGLLRSDAAGASDSCASRASDGFCGTAELIEKPDQDQHRQTELTHAWQERLA